MKIIFTLLSLALLSTPLHANERWYQIELLIFANNSAQALIGERWRAPSLQPTSTITPLKLEEAIADSLYPFETVAEPDKQLLDSVAKMAKHWQYRALLYLSWRQRLVRDEIATPVYFDNQVIVKEADPFVVSANRLNQRFGDGFSSNEFDTTANEALFELSGTAAVTLKRYLHLELNLNFNRLLNSKDNDQVRAIYQSLNSDTISFKINESRRMRSKQAHYFDHPAFGVIALITPVESTANVIEQDKQLKIETLPANNNNPPTTAPLQ